jgi:hypothetical protein
VQLTVPETLYSPHELFYLLIANYISVYQDYFYYLFDVPVKTVIDICPIIPSAHEIVLQINLRKYWDSPSGILFLLNSRYDLHFKIIIIVSLYKQ